MKLMPSFPSRLPYVCLLLASLAFVSSLHAQIETSSLSRLASPHLTFAPKDHQKLLADDRRRAADGQPLRYGEAMPVSDVWLRDGLSSRGKWEQRADGKWVWRLLVSAPGATSLDFGFSDLFLPHGAEIRVYDLDRTVERGPFDERHNNRQSVWTPVVPGPEAVIELVVEAELRRVVSLKLDQVNYGYRFFTDRPFALDKSAECNVDVVCPEGEPFVDQTRSVVAMTQGQGVGLCTGTLINNTANDNRPLVLTSRRCGISSAQAPTVVFYFNYQSDECREDGSSGIPLPRQDFRDTLSGSTLVASYEPSDFTLLELREDVPESFNAFLSGWDRSDASLASAFSIHHPLVEEKRLSIENQPVFAATNTDNREGWSPATHYQVERWDIGITEGGSEGGALFNENGLITGQRTSGTEYQCPGAEEGPDYFGRLGVSWDGGGTADSRLSDHLDPIQSGAVTQIGADACAAPSVSIASSKGAVSQVGDRVDFTADVSGQGPFTYAWDVDADGVIDATGPTAQAIYPEAFSGSLELQVTDAAGCSARQFFGIAIEAPEVSVSAAGDAVQSCGNGDANIDPGEIWSFPLSIRNDGPVAATGALAGFNVAPASALSKLAEGAKVTGGPDGFGYTFADSAESSCSYRFQDISETGTRLTFNPAFNNFPALDDGWVDVDLAPAQFEFYGERIDTIRMSTNGYLSTELGPAESGQDVSPDCPLPTPPGSGGGGRFNALHLDLVLNAGFHEYFSSCPRPSDEGVMVGCHIFQWDIRSFVATGDTPGLSAQAILYDQTSQVVYQYSGMNPLAGDGQTVGIQNRTGNIASTYACDGQPQGLTDNSAVCLFYPEQRSALLSDELRLSQGAISLGTLGSGESRDVEVVTEIRETMACGDRFQVNYVGTGHDRGFSGPGTVTAAIDAPVAENCTVVTSCVGPDQAAVQPREGFWFNALRSGNGIDLHFAGAGLYSAWYTADVNRLPIWYYVQSLREQRLTNDYVTADILRFRLVGDIRQSQPRAETVGSATISFVDESNALMTWTIDGEPGGELLRFFDLSATADVDAVLTDQYFSPAEAGWGIGTHRQGNQEFSTIYFYDTEGQPRWVAVVSDGAALSEQGTAELASFRAHCPGCIWTPPVLLPGGTIDRPLEPNGSALINRLDVRVEGDLSINWLRQNLPLQQVTPP